MAAKTTDMKSALGQLEGMLELYLVDKAPFSLPANVKEIIVSFAPWLTLLGLIIAIPGILLAFGLGAIVAPITGFMGPAYAAQYGMMYVASMIILAITVVLEALAIPGLFKRSAKGWRFVYYASLLGAVSSIVGGNLIGGIIGAVIGLYFVFQVKGYYK